jgi:spermidine/putrescine transport system permease protein
MPAVIAAALIGFLQSFENYNTTLFVRGTETPLTVYIASKVRTGITPAVNALGLVLIALTILGAIVYEAVRRREVRTARIAPPETSAAPPVAAALGEPASVAGAT